MKTRPDHERNLKSHEVNLVIDEFLYYLTPDRRADFAGRFPEIYAKLCGWRPCRLMGGGHNSALCSRTDCADE